MSIQGQINRIATNVDSTLNTIATKGVVVPATASSDDMASLVAEIATVKMVAYQISLPITGWSDTSPHTISISVPETLENDADCSVVVSYTPGYKTEYVECGVECVGQQNGVLVFQVETIPSETFPVNVMLLIK